MNSNTGAVSVVIPSYRRADTLRRAIDSVINQTYKDLEILVVDDNIVGDEFSKALHDIIDEYKDDSRVRLVTQPKHINGAEARNAGIRAARGEWIAFLDDDDEWLPTKIENQLAALESHPECMGVSCLYSEFCSGKLIHSCPPYNTDNFNFKIFTRQVAVFTSTVLLNREKLLEFGAFNNKLRRHQDLQLLLDFTSRNKMTVVLDYLVNLHIDSGINRPSLNKFIEIKKDFFTAVDTIYNLYSKSEQQLIRSAHCYEIVFSAIKEKKYIVALQFFFRAGFHPVAFRMLKQRFRDRKYIAK